MRIFTRGEEARKEDRKMKLCNNLTFTSSYVINYFNALIVTYKTGEYKNYKRRRIILFLIINLEIWICRE